MLVTGGDSQRNDLTHLNGHAEQRDMHKMSSDGGELGFDYVLLQIFDVQEHEMHGLENCCFSRALKDEM